MTEFTSRNPILFLGYTYNVRSFEKAKTRMNKLISVTYRKGYENLGDSYLTSDAGWGCAIRSTQTMFVNVLLEHLECTENGSNLPEKFKEHFDHCIRLVYDSIDAPLSLHKFYILPVVQRHNPTGHNWMPPSVCSTAFSYLFN